jgi:hypothetical protein
LEYQLRPHHKIETFRVVPALRALARVAE